MFDYYELKFVFHGADCKRRAADMDEARAAKKELQAAGVNEITIFGVKKGTKEIQAAKKAYVKPEFKHEPAPKAAKTPKAKKAPSTKKKAKSAAQNISALGFDTEIVEPAGQLDLFTGLPVEITGKRFKNYKIKFTNDELFEIVDSYDHFTGKRNKNLEETIKQAQKLNKDVTLDLSENEIKNIIDSLRNYYVKYYFEDTIKLQKQLEKILQ